MNLIKKLMKVVCKNSNIIPSQDAIRVVRTALREKAKEWEQKAVKLDNEYPHKPFISLEYIQGYAAACDEHSRQLREMAGEER